MTSKDWYPRYGCKWAKEGLIALVVIMAVVQVGAASAVRKSHVGSIG